MPFLGPYAMTKFAIEGAASALYHELNPLGVKVAIIEPSSYDTGFNQKNTQTKYEWMDKTSSWWNLRSYIKKFEQFVLRTQLKRTDSIARQSG